MKTSHTILAIVLSAATLGGAAFAASTTDTSAAVTTQTDNWLTIPAIYEKVTAAGYHDISEIERERKGYEIKAISPSGERVKLFVDPVTGEVLDAKSKKDKSDKYRTDAKRDQGADSRGKDAGL